MGEAFVAIRHVAETNTQEATTTTESLNLVLVETRNNFEEG